LLNPSTMFQPRNPVKTEKPSGEDVAMKDSKPSYENSEVGSIVKITGLSQ